MPQFRSESPRLAVWAASGAEAARWPFAVNMSRCVFPPFWRSRSSAQSKRRLPVLAEQQLPIGETGVCTSGSEASWCARIFNAAIPLGEAVFCSVGSERRGGGALAVGDEHVALCFSAVLAFKVVGAKQAEIAGARRATTATLGT